jgi:SAM-dependent methyltransferase
LESSYIYDQAWGEEKRRLDALAALYDSGTIDRLEGVGVEPGAAWLEVGAGSGTIAAWLAGRVGGEGRVMATDLDTRFLADLADNIEVVTHDIVGDDLEREVFDGVHARAVLEHLPDRAGAIANMVTALRPGGVLLLEDVVFPPACSHPPTPVLEKVVEAFASGFRAVGADPNYGLQLPSALGAAGLVDVDCDGHAPVAFTGSPSSSFMLLSLEHLRDRFIGAGLLTEADVSEALQDLGNPGRTLLPPMMISAWGRKPG